jgi:hypothetical protein
MCTGRANAAGWMRGRKSFDRKGGNAVSAGGSGASPAGLSRRLSEPARTLSCRNYMPAARPPAQPCDGASGSGCPAVCSATARR